MSAKVVLRSVLGATALASFVLFAGCKDDTAAGSGASATSSNSGGAEASKPAAAKPGVAAKEGVAAVKDMAVYDANALKAAIAGGGAKLTVVALWATWCGPCIKEMPHLSEFHGKHAKDGIRVVGLCTDDKADMSAKIQGVLDKTKVDYQQALLKPGTEEELFKSIGEEWDGMLPKTIVFDAAGKKVAFFAEAVDDKILNEKVVPLLGGK